MGSDRIRTLLTQASKLTRKRSQQNLEFAPEETKVVLSLIEENLFTPGFTAASIDEYPLVGSGFQRRFRSHIGVGPRKYLKRRRLEVAAWLLKNTNEKIWQVAVAIGHTRYANFTRDFKNWAGKPPARFRQEHGRNPQSPSSLSPSIAVWWKALAGELSTRDAQRLIARVEARTSNPTSSLSKPRTDAIVSFGGKLYGQEQAEIAWQALDGETHTEQELLLRYSIRFASHDLFNFLSEKSRVEGREDRQLGIELARLALASLQGSSELLGDEVYDLIALGWARLGQARRLALDKDGADEDLLRSDENWKTPPRTHDRVIEAEICSLKGTLRLHQRRFDEALDLLHRAVALSRTTGNTGILIRSLIQRAKIEDYLGNPGNATTDLQLVLRLLAETDEDSYLTLVTYTNLATSYAWSQDRKRAKRFLEEAKELCEELHNRLISYQLQWVEGLIAGDDATAEALFRQAHIGFIELNEFDHAAVVALELAILCYRKQSLKEVVNFASEALPILGALRCYPEAATSYGLLAKALAKDTVTLDLLQEVRGCLVSISKDPCSSLGQASSRTESDARPSRESRKSSGR